MQEKCKARYRRIKELDHESLKKQAREGARRKRLRYLVMASMLADAGLIMEDFKGE